MDIKKIIEDLIVAAVNDQPIAQDIEITLYEDNLFNFTFDVSDVDNTNDQLSIYIQDDIEFGILSVSGINATLSPSDHLFGDFSLAYQALDGELFSSPAILTVHILPVNDAPVLTDILDQESDEDTPLTITLTADDVESAAISFTASSDIEAVSVFISGDELTITKITRFVRVSGVIFSITLIVVVVMLLRLMHRLVERFSIQIPQKRMLFHKIETIAQFFIYVGLAISIFLLSFRINEQLLSIIGGTVAVSFGFAIKDLIASFIAGFFNLL